MKSTCMHRSNFAIQFCNIMIRNSTRSAMLRAMCPAVMVVTVTALCFVNVARALFCQVQSAHILGNVFAVINFYPSYMSRVTLMKYPQAVSICTLSTLSCTWPALSVYPFHVRSTKSTRQWVQYALYLKTFFWRHLAMYLAWLCLCIHFMFDQQNLNALRRLDSGCNTLSI